MKFRTDISFLRAVSVIIVMLFHFQVAGFSGGFIGVDVFFVISGFLMTQITLKSFDKDNFSLRNFYIKRAKRIIPPLHFMLYFVLAISVVLFLKTDLKLNAKYTFLSNLFVSNIYFWKYQDYFTSDDNILLHTWSLGVEWQFYLIYPIILLLLKRVYVKAKNMFWIILSALTILSFLIMIFLHNTDNNFAFYMLPSRFWELSIGGIAYGLSYFQGFKNGKKITIATLSVMVIMACSVLISDKMIWPSPYTVLPVLSTVLILAVNVNTMVFDNKLVKTLGDISYSLYLWHWPWFILFKYFGFLDPGHIVLLILVSVLSAVISFYFVEKKKIFASGTFLILSTILIALLSAVLFLKPKTASQLSVYRDKKYAIGEYFTNYSKKKEFQFNPCNCFISDKKTLSDYDNTKCLKLSDTLKNVMLIGDSHAAQYSSSLREKKQFNIIEADAGFTFPFLNARGRANTIPLNHFIFNDFMPKNHQKIDLVIFSAHWLMNENPYVNYSEDQIKSGLQELIKYFHKYEIKYLVIGQSESYTLPYPRIAMLMQLGRKEKEFVNPKALWFNNMVKQIIPKENYIEIYNSKEIDHLNKDKTVPYMIDSNHYSKYGADQVINKLVYNRVITKLDR